jgi:uncharacterized protein YneF (UPF0154 family)
MKKRIPVFLVAMFYSALLASVLVGFFSGEFAGRGMKSKLAANAPLIAAIVPIAIWWMVKYFRKKSKKKSMQLDSFD